LTAQDDCQRRAREAQARVERFQDKKRAFGIDLKAIDEQIKEKADARKQEQRVDCEHGK
jgi:hypothetical protein